MLISIGEAGFYPFDLLYPDRPMMAIYHEDECAEWIQEGSIVILWGGEDISPTLYNALPIPGSGPYKPSRRDNLECAVLRRAMDVGALVIGVCRGMQIMTAFCDGQLIQDTRGHAVGDIGHSVNTVDGARFSVNSYHHQLCVPRDDCIVLASANDHPNHKQYGFTGEIEDKFPWVEAIDFRPAGLRGFGVQWHPEWMESHSEATEWIFKQLKEF